jgi:acyl-coenzyme A thioesterase PaaI-like protein
MGKLGVVKMAVTSNFNINFLRRPHPGTLLADARALKVGKRLAMLDVIIHSKSHDGPVAHATGTYSVPQQNA